jgi:Ran GTPase-activating protein (RanGAP) involved in mRNA processing and transport
VSARSLKQLSLWENGFDARTAAALGDALCQNTTLTHVSFSRNPFGREGGRALLDGISRSASIEVRYASAELRPVSFSSRVNGASGQSSALRLSCSCGAAAAPAALAQ